MQKQADKNHLTAHIIGELKVIGNLNKESHYSHLHTVKTYGTPVLGILSLPKLLQLNLGYLG